MDQENVACAATEKFHVVTPILNAFPCSQENPRCVLSSVLSFKLLIYFKGGT